MEVLTEEEYKFLGDKAKTIRRHIIKMLAEAGSGHTGGSLSCADILTCLYFKVMRHNPKEPRWPDRDRFILSKGHAAPTLYACLAETGYFDKELLLTLRKINSKLQGHPSTILPGVEISSGSLGQGLSVSCGVALAGKLDKKTYRVFVLIGDGECDEGNIWEGVLTGAHYKLDNLTCILDRNRMQIDGYTEDVMALEPLNKKFEAFGWEVIEIDGHNYKEIVSALTKKNEKGKPKMVIAHTIKGKGVSFIENKVEWHGIAPTKEEAEKALKELE